MEDLSGITVPKIQVTEGFSVLPQTVMQELSGEAQISQAVKLMGFKTEETADGRS
jgi:hypothetical protein